MTVALFGSVRVVVASDLPPCPSSGYFHNCFGTKTYADGNKYVGEFKDNEFNGQGTYSYANGDATLISPHPDTSYRYDRPVRAFSKRPHLQKARQTPSPHILTQITAISGLHC